MHPACVPKAALLAALAALQPRVLETPGLAVAMLQVGQVVRVVGPVFLVLQVR